jgi:hypothetical protein
MINEYLTAKSSGISGYGGYTQKVSQDGYSYSTYEADVGRNKGGKLHDMDMLYGTSDSSSQKKNSRKRGLNDYVPYVNIDDLDEFTNRKPVRYTDKELTDFNRALNNKFLRHSEEDDSNSATAISGYSFKEPDELVKEIKNKQAPLINNNADSSVTHELFKAPTTLDELPKQIWTNMYHFLPPMFTKQIKDHQYIIEIAIRYQPKLNRDLANRKSYSLADHISEALECGLFKSKETRVSHEYYMVDYTLIDRSDDTETAVHGEDLSKELDKGEITACIEDRLDIHIVLPYEGTLTDKEMHSFITNPKKKDTRKLKFGAIFFTVTK